MIRILIVDDDLEVVRALGTTFMTILKGYLIFTATTANQGLNLIKEQKPELIIMDVRLGPVSGMDLLEDYSKYLETYRPHVIVITAYQDEKAKQRAEALGVDAYLLKPFSQDDLLGTVFESLEKYHEAELRSVRFALQGFRKKQASVEEFNKGLDQKLKETP